MRTVIFLIYMKFYNMIFQLIRYIKYFIQEKELYMLKKENYIHYGIKRKEQIVESLEHTTDERLINEILHEIREKELTEQILIMILSRLHSQNDLIYDYQSELEHIND